MRYLRLILTASLIVAFASCKHISSPLTNSSGYSRPSAVTSSSGNAHSTASTSTSTPSAPTIDDEARKQAEQYWAENSVKCGGDYYFLVRLEDSDGMHYGLYQLRGFSINMEPGSLSNADRLNGYEWRGTVEYKIQNTRRYERGWEAWREGGIFPYRPNPLVVSIIKKNGQWEVQAPKRRVINCESIPQ